MFPTLFTAISIIASPPSSYEPILTCAEDAQATSITFGMAGLPAEVRRDLIRATRGNIGERPRLLRQSDVITVENREHLNIRFYRALLVRGTWYVQIEHALMTGVHTLGYARQANGEFQRSVGVHFAGPACETIKAALSGVDSSVWYLSR